MANNRFNKQVSPKGYKDGGKASPPFKDPYEKFLKKQKKNMEKMRKSAKDMPKKK